MGCFDNTSRNRTSLVLPLPFIKKDKNILYSASRVFSMNFVCGRCLLASVVLKTASLAAFDPRSYSS